MRFLPEGARGLHKYSGGVFQHCRCLVRRTGLGILVLAGASLVSDSAALFLQVDRKPVGAAFAQQASTVQPLSANDVSWLFPPPVRAEDFDTLISIRDLTTQNPEDPTKHDPLWPDAEFAQFLSITASPAALVAGTPPQRISLPPEVRSIDVWRIAGVRIDAGAPGLSDDIREQFGQSPEVRLILQPVTRNADGTPKVHDIAAHLKFAFVKEIPGLPPQLGCFPRQIPDLIAFRGIVEELASLRTKLGEGQLGANKVTTSGTSLGVHPGLKDPTTASQVRQEMKAFLERHISGRRLAGMAVMGLPEGASAPWIFLSMLNLAPILPNGIFVPLKSPALDGQQFAQMLNPVGSASRVVPTPHPNNLAPITCRNAAVPFAELPIGERNGVSTAELFATPSPPPDKVRSILDLIADPAKSHFFNTDCVSCHTETRRGMDLLGITEIPGIDTAVLPNGQYNVRNFGWSPPIEGPVQGTVTRRTAAETAAVVTFINSKVLTPP
jgi:hypothetical protein